jgi:hypothetical protein
METAGLRKRKPTRKSEGVDGLTRDKTRKPGKPPLPAGTPQRVVDLALSAPPQIGNELTSIPERENVNSTPLDEKRTFWLFAFGCD